MLSQFDPINNIIRSPLKSMLSAEEQRTGFKIILESSGYAVIQCGNLGQYRVPIKAFPKIYSTLIWDVLKSLRGASVFNNKLVFNKYYIAWKDKNSGKILIPREILEKIPELYDVTVVGPRIAPRLENLTLNTLMDLCNWGIDVAEFILQPNDYALYCGAIYPNHSYLACYRGKWNILIYRENTSDYALWRFGLEMPVSNLNGIEIRIIPDSIKSMQPKILSYRFESGSRG